VTITIDEPIKYAGRVFGIDCNLNKSCRPCPCCIVCTTRLNYVPLYTCTFSFFVGKSSDIFFKWKFSLENLHRKKCRNSFHAGTWSKKRKRDCVLLVVIDILMGRTNTHHPILLFISSPSQVPFIFFLSFSFYEVEKRLTSEMKKKNAQLTTCFCYPFLVFFHRLGNLFATILSYCQIFFISSLFLVGGGL
jgi:hypothetical protein